MRARIGHRGNSLALRIPRSIVEELDLSQDSEAILNVEDHRLTITFRRPERKKRMREPAKPLSWYLESIESGQQSEEIPIGPAKRKEL